MRAAFPSSPSSTSLSWWREGVDFARRQPLAFGAATFPMLLFVRPWDWIALLWVFGWALISLWSGRETWFESNRHGRAAAWLTAAFLAWMWAGFFYGAKETPTDYGFTFLNAFILILLLSGWWRAAMRRSRLDWALRGLIVMAVATAAVSIPVYYVFRGHDLVLERLENVAVYQGAGLYSVNSALLWGFAAAAALAGCAQAATRRGALWLASAAAFLTMAVCLTQTRGALLGLGAALLALILTRPFRVWASSAVLVAASCWMVQFSVPRVAASPQWLALRGGEQRMSAPAAAFAAGLTANKVTMRPAQMMLYRSDSGRLPFYELLLGRMTGPAEVLAGRGFFARDSADPSEIQWAPTHPHGAFLSTYYHGGIIGLALLLALVWKAAAPAAWLARRGLDARWFALLAAGCAALLVDGQTLALAGTIPMTETLLFWIPAIAAAAHAAGIRERMEAAAF